jgi:glycosyltransferase involved in cell wall biosynthesis
LETVKAQYRLPENFILFVGSIEPRKNLKRLLQAYTDMDDKIRKEFKLVLIGFKGWENEEIMRLIHKLKSDIFYLGYLPEEELGKLYNLARLSIYPSLYEGFGLPPLEAMACGCPIIVSHTASLPEVCGDAAFYADPQGRK